MINKSTSKCGHIWKEYYGFKVRNWLWWMTDLYECRQCGKVIKVKKGDMPISYIA